MNGDIKYAGFFRRFAAMLIDSLLLIIILTPLTFLFTGVSHLTGFECDGDLAAQAGSLGFDWASLLITDLLPMVLIIFFWVRYRGTPGKHLMDCQVVDATTFDNLRLRQAILRYVGYFLSLLPLGLGFFWMLWDSKKRGFHDLIAHTVVIQIPLSHLADTEADKSIEQRIKEVE